MANTTPQTFDWFLQFNGFTHDPDTLLRSNFNRLALQQTWSREEKAELWTDCQKAVFSTMYNDADSDKLSKWQDLCVEVGIEKIPCSITACKKALGAQDVMVNLVNLIDHRTLSVPLMRFSTYGAFLNYTRKTGHRFPRQQAKDDGFIKALLRKLS